MTRRTATALVLAVPILLVLGSALSRAALDTGLSPLVGGLAEMVGGLALLLDITVLVDAELVGKMVRREPESRPEPPGDGGTPAWTVGWTGVLLPGVSFFSGLVFLKETSVGVSATALGVQPLAVFLLLAALGRALPRRPHPGLIVLSAVASTAVGASLLVGGGGAIRVGGLVAGGVQVLANAAFLVVDEGSRAPVGETQLARRQLTWALGFAAVIVGVAALAGAVPADEVTGGGVAWSTLAGAVSAGLPILVLSRLARSVPSSFVGAGLGLVPAVALLVGWAAFDESVPWPSLALAVVATAVLVAVGAAQEDEPASTIAPLAPAPGRRS